MIPSLLQVEITSHCNMACSICPHKIMKRLKGHMNFNVFKRVVDESKRLKWPIHWLHHFGEPLLHPDLEEFLKYFKEHGYGPGAISTNGLALNKELRETLIKYSQHVRVALDSFDAEIYKKLRTGDHQQVLNNTRALIQESKGTPLKVEIQIMKTKFNPNELIKDDAHIFYKNIVHYPGTNNIKSDKSMKQTCHNQNLNELCVLWNGDLTCCCFDYEGALSFGNINDKPLNLLWDDKSTRVTHDNPFCNACQKN